MYTNNMAHHKSIQPATTICFTIIMSLALTAQTIPTLHPYKRQNDFVVVHNDVRAAVGVGPMKWNETLAAYARAYANRRASTGCNLVHSNGPYGENLAEGYGEMSGAETVKYWATEKANYVYATNKCTPGQVCGHYTQIVWRDSVRLGCARAKCPKGLVFVICSYDPPGNYIGARPY